VTRNAIPRLIRQGHQARREVYATARMVDSCAAQLEMLSEVDGLMAADRHDIYAASRQMRLVATRLFEQSEPA